MMRMAIHLHRHASAGVRAGSTLYYVLKDQLGSASVVTNTSGAIVGEDRFYPFGEACSDTDLMLRGIRLIRNPGRDQNENHARPHLYFMKFHLKAGRSKRLLCPCL